MPVRLVRMRVVVLQVETERRSLWNVKTGVSPRIRRESDEVLAEHSSGEEADKEPG